MAANPTQVADVAATQLLEALVGLGQPVQVCRTAGGLTCVVQVYPTKTGAPRAVLSERRAQCRRDIVAAVRAAGRAITRKQLMRTLRERGTPHGLGTVAKALAELTKGGELVNRKDKHGYRLPEWPKPSRTPSLFD